MATKNKISNDILPTKLIQKRHQDFTKQYFDGCVQSRDFLKKVLGDRQPSIAVILGSGLGNLAEHPDFEDTIRISYSEIPNFAIPSVAGHSGEFITSRIKGTNTYVAFLSGRTHPYESMGWVFLQVLIIWQIIFTLLIKRSLLI